MATFYGGAWGNRGEATRMGSKDSGMRVYAQSYDSRISVNYDMRGDEDVIAHVTLGGGWTTYHRDHTLTFNPDLLAEALDCGDDRMNCMWGRVEALFKRMGDEAPKAIKRAERKRKKAMAA